MRLTFYVFALAIITALASCSDPTLVGAGLLEDDRADVGFSDTLSIAASSITNDSVRTYGPFLSNQLSAYLFGNFNDPLFGRSSASIYAQVFPQNSGPEFDDNTVVDSIVLVLPYDIDGFYGKTEGETFGMEVFQLAEVLEENSEYFSDDEVAAEPMPLASVQATISTDSLDFIDYEGTDTVAVKFPHYRIHLDDGLADYLIGLDSAVYASDSLFLDAFKGFFLQPGTENEGMLSFGLLSDAGIYLYYHDDAEEKPRRFLYDFDIQPTVRFTNYRHDYQSALAGEFLDGSKPEDSLLFVQGMSGLDVRLEIPNITDLQGLVVNKAELEFYAADVEGDDEAFTLSPQLILTTLNSNGDLATIEDIEIIRAQGRNLAELFGGIPLEDASGGPAVYRMNVSAHLQDVIDGNRSNVLFITPLQKASTAERAVLYGAGHPRYSMKLKITFTKI